MITSVVARPVLRHDQAGAATALATAIVMDNPKPTTVESRLISSPRGIVDGMSARNACIETMSTIIHRRR